MVNSQVVVKYPDEIGNTPLKGMKEEILVDLKAHRLSSQLKYKDSFEGMSVLGDQQQHARCIRTCGPRSIRSSC